MDTGEHRRIKESTKEDTGEHRRGYRRCTGDVTEVHRGIQKAFQGHNKTVNMNNTI